MSDSKWLLLKEEKQQNDKNGKEGRGLITGTSQKKDKILKFREIHDSA